MSKGEDPVVGLSVDRVIEFIRHMQGSVMLLQTDINTALKSVQEIQNNMLAKGQTTFDNSEEPVIAGSINKETKDDSNGK